MADEGVGVGPVAGVGGVLDAAEVAEPIAAEVIVEAEPVEVKPFIVVEDGEGVRQVETERVYGRERVVSVGGQSYEHCADGPDGGWIYRAVAF